MYNNDLFYLYFWLIFDKVGFVKLIIEQS